MKRLTINLSDDLHKRLKLHCVLVEKEMAELIRHLIEEHLDKAEKKVKK